MLNLYRIKSTEVKLTLQTVNLSKLYCALILQPRSVEMFALNVQTCIGSKVLKTNIADCKLFQEVPENLAGVRTTVTIMHFVQWGLFYCYTLYVLVANCCYV